MPLTLTYESSYGTITDAFHVIDDVYVVSGSDPNTAVTGSAWLNEAAYKAGKDKFVTYMFTFNSLFGSEADGKTPAVLQPDIYSQSYAYLKTINSTTGAPAGSNFRDTEGNVPAFNFLNATSSKFS
tara:strand:- start:4111 stop:4488 length:378 start_codon:yes stop_codon:yes gene_type:complete